MMKPAFMAIGTLSMLLLGGCASIPEGFGPLDTVATVDVQRYLGRWYEIARLPTRFERGCTNTTATYSRLESGMIEVLNECRVDGKVSKIRGRAKVADRKTRAKLKVSFFGPFWADYWIIGLGADYDYAVVGSPNRKYLWILSRNVKMDESAYAMLAELAESQGFDTGRLEKTVHEK